MSPLGTVVLGQLVVLLDLRLPAVDVLPDVLGWLLVLLGLSRLVRRSAAFSRTRTWAVVAAMLSLADVAHRQVTTTTSTDGSLTSSVTSTVVPGGLQGLLITAYGVAVVVVAVLLSLAMRDLAGRYGAPELAARFALFARLHLSFGVLVGVLGLVAVLTQEDGTIEPQGAAAALTLLVVVTLLAVEVWFLATLARIRDLPWLHDEEPSAEATA